jgi:hypothetical protein
VSVRLCGDGELLTAIADFRHRLLSLRRKVRFTLFPIVAAEDEQLGGSEKVADMFLGGLDALVECLRC